MVLSPVVLKKLRGQGPEKSAGVYHESGERPGAAVPKGELLRRFAELRDVDWSGISARFPVRVPRAWGEGSAVMLKQALPDSRELLLDAGDVPDPVGEQAMSPMPWVVRKHADRVLLMLTKRCHLYCRYCFRADHKPGEGMDPTAQEWSAMLDYAAGSGAEEVILSGGDPLALNNRRLFEAIDGVRVRPVVRVHTRAPITAPERVTDALVRGLRERSPVWVVVHCNHVDELTDAVRAALGRLVDGGVPVLNQSVLLRGVNDDVESLVLLSTELVRLRVFPYYLHHPDAVPGNAHFRVTKAEGLALYAGLRARVSGLGCPQYVWDPPDGSGKVGVS